MNSDSRTRALRSLSPLLLFPALLGLGCSRQQPVVMAPPMENNIPLNTAPPVMDASQQGQGQGQGAVPTGEGVFDWHDVPTGQQIPITRGVFDQSGYQLFAQSGETIVVPFANQNMYVMRFGKSLNGGMYFTSDGAVPTLYVPNGGSLENAVAQGARWFPFPQNYAYTQPVYLGIAPSWNAYTGMGWYPGMSYYGGYWSPHPYGYGGGISPFVAMVGLNFLIGGRPYYGWNSYQNYYRYNPSSSVRMRTVYNYNSVRRSSPSAFGRSRYSSGNSGGRRFGSGGTGSTGSFGSSRRFGSSGGTGSTGSFGSSNRRFGSGSGSSGGTGSFGGSRRFGSGSGSTFGSSRPPGPSGSFGSGSSSGYSSSTRRGTGSFGSGSSSGYGGSFGGGSRRGFGSGSSSPSFGGGSSPSFGSSRRSGGSFGGGSFGGGSFGGSRRSSGGFGRRR